MKAARLIGIVVVLIVGARCSTESAVQPADADTFTVSARAPADHAGVLIAQSAALQDARAYCTGQGKRFAIVADQVSEGTFAQSVTYSVRFRCPVPGSPDLPRPTVNQSPDLL